MQVTKINSVVITGTVKQLKHQPTTCGYRSRTIALVQVDRKTVVRVVLHNTYAAKLTEGVLAKIYGQLHSWAGGLEVRATNVLIGDAIQEQPIPQRPLTPKFADDPASVAAADRGAGRLLGGNKPEEVTQ